MSQIDTKNFLYKIRTDLTDGLVKLCSEKPDDPHAMLAGFLLGRSKQQAAQKINKLLHGSPMVSGITVTDYNSLIVHWEVSEPIIGKQTYYHEFELALDRGAEERKSKDKESHRMKQLYVGTKQHYEHKIDPNKAHKYVFRVRGRTDHGWQDWSEGFSYFTHVSNESDLPSFSSSSAQQTKSDTPWSFDNNMKGSHIKFSNSSHTATSTDAYQSVAVSQWIRRGTHSIYLHIDNVGSLKAETIAIGCVNRHFNGFQKGFLGCDEWAKSSWGVTGNGLKNPHSGASPNYVMQFNAGDVIRMTADMDKRTVSYAVNGVHCGTAFSDIDEEVAFAVSLYAAGEAVTVISAKQAAAYELFWDQQKRGDRVKISTDGRTASASSEDQIVALNNWITSGVHSFVFQVDHHAKDVCIGAISRNFKHYSSGTLGVGEHAKHSYGITPKSKHPSQDRRSSSSSSQHSRDSAYAPFESGDLVRMTVNLDKKTISYAVNGIDYGVAFEDVDSELCPAVSFASSGAQVTLLVGSPTYRSPFMFDATMKGSHIQLSDYNRTAVATAENQTVAATPWLTKGTHSVLFRVNQDSHYMCIGVISRPFKGFSAGYLGYGEHERSSMGVSTGAKYPNPHNDRVSLTFQNNDVVRMVVDMHHRTISYFVNGVSFGKIFSQIDDEVCVAVSLHSVGDSVTLLAP